MMKRSLQFLLAGAAVVPLVAFTFGGWAVVTVDDLPEYAVAGKPVNISFTVRQHGMMLLRGLTAGLTAAESGAKDSVAASMQTALGTRYAATITLPHAGDWALTIHSGFGPISLTLMPIKAVASAAAWPPPVAEKDRGERLFTAKGCVTCHVRGEADPQQSYTQGVGPALTGRQYPPEYLATFLADPEKSPLSKTNTTQWRMPNLELKPAEIKALVAFINSESGVAAQTTRR